MSEHCLICNKSTIRENDIRCSNYDCSQKYHRQCVKITDLLYREMVNNPYISFNCPSCSKLTKKHFNEKFHQLEEKFNKLLTNLNVLHSAVSQAYDRNYIASMTPMNTKPPVNNNSVIMGSNSSLTERLQVVCDFSRWVQVGKFSITTSENDIIDYVSERLKLPRSLVKCSKLLKNKANQRQMSYCKFKVSIPEYRFDELFNESIWPSGVMVSSFTPRSHQHQHRI